MTIDFYVSNIRYILTALPVFLGISLMATGPAQRYNILKRASDCMAAYFFSFSPVALLLYLLYKISLIQ